LAQRGYGVDVFHDAERGSRSPDSPADLGEVRLQSAHDFVWRQLRGQYDLAVYQIGNSRWHHFIWPYLFHWPGLVVLHDARLHHARARRLLTDRRVADYRAEFAWNQPEVSPDLAELAIAGFDGAYYYQWPALRAVLQSARLAATHARGAIDTITAEWPATPVEYIALGMGRDTFDVREARTSFRRAHGVPDATPVFGVFGALTATKRVPQILESFSVVRSRLPESRLVLAGHPDPMLDIPGSISTLALGDSVLLLDDRDDAAFDQAIAAVDVSLNLRWPSALETSGPWLQSLALGRPTIVTDLAHQSHLPTIDPHTWRPRSSASSGDPIAVSIDILDESHSLRAAMLRLATDEPLRARLGAAGRAHWEREHTLDRMVADYDRVLRLAAERPAPAPDGPPHVRPSRVSAVSQWLDRFDLPHDDSLEW
jgi:glycosyltransferase involved in cell wall biosynthesis